MSEDLNEKKVKNNELPMPENNTGIWKTITDSKTYKSVYFIGFLLGLLTYGVILSSFICAIFLVSPVHFLVLLLVGTITQLIIIHGFAYSKSLTDGFKKKWFSICSYIGLYALVKVIGLFYFFFTGYLAIFLFFIPPNIIIISSHFESKYIDRSKNSNQKITIFVTYVIKMAIFALSMILIYFSFENYNTWVSNYTSRFFVYIKEIENGLDHKIMRSLFPIMFFLLIYIIPILIFCIYIPKFKRINDKFEIHFLAVIYLIVIYYLIIYGVVIYIFANQTFELYGWVLRSFIIAFLAVGIKAFDLSINKKENEATPKELEETPKKNTKEKT